MGHVLKHPRAALTGKASKGIGEGEIVLGDAVEKVRRCLPAILRGFVEDMVVAVF